jgi:hypothetical protein
MQFSTVPWLICDTSGRGDLGTFGDAGGVLSMLLEASEDFESLREEGLDFLVPAIPTTFTAGDNEAPRPVRTVYRDDEEVSEPVAEVA